MSDSRLLPPRVTQGVLSRDDVDFAERIGEAGGVHRGQVTGPQNRAEERVLRLIVINGYLQPSEDYRLAVICGVGPKNVEQTLPTPKPCENSILINSLWFIVNFSSMAALPSEME